MSTLIIFWILVLIFCLVAGIREAVNQRRKQ